MTLDDKGVIYKYKIDFGCTVTVPSNAEVVHVGMQGGTVNVWMRHDAVGECLDQWTFVVVGTGHTFSCEWEHVGTVIDGAFVWHVMREP